MKVSRAQAEQNRERVVDVAGGLFRTRGFDGVSVADLMKGAGLTHGGFYGNFDSKDDLEVEAVSRAFAKTKTFLAELTADADDPLAAIIRFYLSPEHRDQVDSGCTIAALAQDAARSGPALRAAFERGIRDYLALLSDALPESSEAARMQRSMVTLSTLLGALILARTVEDEKLSDALLAAATQSLIQGPSS